MSSEKGYDSPLPKYLRDSPPPTYCKLCNRNSFLNDDNICGICFANIYKCFGCEKYPCSNCSNCEHVKIIECSGCKEVKKCENVGGYYKCSKCYEESYEGPSDERTCANYF